MKNKPRSVENGSTSAAASHPKTHRADGASAQTPEALLKLVRRHATWNITSGAGKALHRTLDGQLILADRKPADVSGYIEYTGARLVSYAEACKWIPTSGNDWKPEVLLQFHGITDPARSTATTPQSNTAEGRAKPCSASTSPCIALFPRGNSGVAGETIRLSKAQYAALQRAFGDDSGLLWFMVKAALERLGASRPAPVQPAQEIPLGSAHQQLETVVSEAVSVIAFLSEAYWGNLDVDQEDQRARGDEVTSLAVIVSNHLETEFGRACDEWREACGRSASTSEPVGAMAEEHLTSRHDDFDLAISAAAAAISLLCEVYWDSISQNCEGDVRQAKGIISLAHGVSGRLKMQSDLASDEWRAEASRSTQLSAQRRAE
jgi:hypothetical protein